jgi:hypothetical protein
MNLELSAVSLNGLKKAPPEQEVGDIGGSVEPNLRTIPPNNLPPLLGRKDAAAFLKSLGLDVAPRTLAKLACIGGGPAFRHFGRRVRYEPPVLLQWAEGRLSPPRTSTSVIDFRQRVGSRHGVHNAAPPAASASCIGVALTKTRIERQREEAGQ